jgi:hypothetical protein
MSTSPNALNDTQTAGFALMVTDATFGRIAPAFLLESAIFGMASLLAQDFTHAQQACRRCFFCSTSMVHCESYQLVQSRYGLRRIPVYLGPFSYRRRLREFKKPAFRAGLAFSAYCILTLHWALSLQYTSNLIAAL